MSPLAPHQSRNIDLVIFDCDGVLVDSEMIAAIALSAALEEEGVHLHAKDLARRFIGVSDGDTIAALRSEHSRVSSLCQTRYQEHLKRRLDTDLCAIDGIHDVLLSLQSAGVQCCVASSSSPSRLHHTLGSVNLLQYFGDKVFSSSQVLNGKPAPDVFLLASARCGVSPKRCVVIEDSPAGVIAALRAGMPVAGFCGASHCDTDHGLRLRTLGANYTFNRWRAAEFWDYLSGFDPDTTQPLEPR